MPSSAIGSAAAATEPDYNQSIFDFVGNHPVTGGTVPKSGWGGGMAAAAVGAGASLLGGILGNKSQDKANKANEAANKEAIQLQREQMAEQKAQWEQRQAQLQPLLQARYSLLSKYGIKIPTSTGTQPPPVLGTPTGPRMMVNPPIPEQDVTADPRAMAARRFTLGDLPNWSQSAWDGMNIPMRKQQNPG